MPQGLSSYLKSHESFRLFVTYIIPGAIVVLPLIHMFFLGNDIEFHKVFKKHSLSLLLGTFTLASFVGMVVEDLGARLEVFLEQKIFNENSKTSYKKMYKTWLRYLRLNIESGPVGQRYLRNIVTRLKFEINGAVACCVFMLLSVILIVYFKVQAYTLPAAIAGALSLYLIWEAAASIRLLHVTRKNILKGLSKTTPKTSYTA